MIDPPGAGDMTIRTAILETAILTGTSRSTTNWSAALRQGGRAGQRGRVRHREIGRARGAHRRRGQSRYLVSQRQGRKGGLRDLHTLFWIAKYVLSVRNTDELVQHGVFDARNTAPSAAARIFCGRCAATCILSAAAPKSGCRRHAARDRRAGWDITSHPGMQDVNAS